MSVIDRVRNILLSPKTEWPLIAAEPATEGGLFTGYAVPVSLLPVIGMVLGGLLIGNVLGLGFLVVPAILGYLIGLVVLYVVGIVADALAPGFDGRKDRVAAMKLVVHAATPQWVAGFFAFVPGIGLLLSLAGFAYGAYLLYLGAGPVMTVPAHKAVAYTAVLIVIWIVLGMVVGAAIIGAVAVSVMGGMMPIASGYIG